MCRLLAVQASNAFPMREHLEKFATLSKNSREFQGHGWGCAYVKEGKWEIYRNITPIWEDDLTQFGETTLLLAHARSAFRDEGIVVENNMPFVDGTHVFIFNGELRGVKIKAEGRIGAEKIFNYIKRFDTGDMLEAIKKGSAIINKRTAYVRSMNIIIASTEQVFLHTLFNQEPEYFQMHRKHDKDMHIVCSDPYPGEEWEKITNKTIEVLA
ncbi:MAG: hypothetical protein OXR66_07375 [Candidatus Woesearchaeota archaeon]|nr:hypothetical protein [Candidatus Woesearchaeota archaeon]